MVLHENARKILVYNDVLYKRGAHRSIFDFRGEFSQKVPQIKRWWFLVAKIHIVSQIMGSGKTTGMANMLNHDPEYENKRVIYISPFLSECERFKKMCNKTFVEPKAWDQFNNSKLTHIAQLLSEDKSISTTHAAFMRYDEKILSLIRSGNYVLIMDETCSVIEDFDWNAEDVWLLERAGVIDRNGSRYRFNEEHAHYIDNKGTLSELCRKMRYMDLYSYDDENNGKFYYYTMPPAVLQAFSEVYVLTYMWKASDLHLMVTSIGMEWDYMYVDRVDFGNGYMVTSNKPDVPDYVLNIPNLLNVYEHSAGPKKKGRPMKDLNLYEKDERGNKTHHSLSVNFFKEKRKNGVVITGLRNSIRTYLKNVMQEHDGTIDECMWSTYKAYAKDLYSDKNAWMEDKFVSFNERAKNDHSHCRFLVYAVGIFPNPKKKTLYERYGLEYPEKRVALSTMCQWLWRSSLRKGESVYAFVPAQWMREILYDWLESIGNGEDWCEN